MTQEQIESIKEASKHPLFDKLVAWIKDEVNTMDNIHNIHIEPNSEDMAVEVKSVIKASLKLHTILDILIAIKESPENEPTDSGDYGI